MPESLPIEELLIPGIVLGVSFFVFAVIMAIAVRQWIKVAEAKRWAVTFATILESHVEGSSDDGGRQYAPVIKYEYTVGARVHIGDTLAFGARHLTEGGIWGEKKARRFVEKYPVGSRVEIHYQPNLPWKSVLEVRSAIANLLVLIGTAFLLVGTLVAAIIWIVDKPGG